jgi:hypothetical protein
VAKSRVSVVGQGELIDIMCGCSIGRLLIAALYIRAAALAGAIPAAF